MEREGSEVLFIAQDARAATTPPPPLIHHSFQYKLIRAREKMGHFVWREPFNSRVASL